MVSTLYAYLLQHALHSEAHGNRLDFTNYAHSRRMMDFCLNELIQSSPILLGCSVSTGNCPHFIWYASAKKKNAKKKKKEIRHIQLNLAVLKWQLCQSRHTFYLVPVHLPLMFASFSLCHGTRTRLEMTNSEFNKLHSYF